MKEITISEVTRNPNKLRTELDKGPVRLIWKEQKPNGKVLCSAIVKKEEK
jgi:hypothetical protein